MNIQLFASSMAVIIQVCVFLSYMALSSACVLPFEQLPIEQPPCVFPNGSIACKVWNHTNLDCRGRNLVCIPSFPYAGSVKLLDLTHNQMSIVSDNAFSGLHNLLQLNLANNLLTYFQDKAFSGLHALRSLDVSNNCLLAPLENVFSELHELQSLDLSYNYIRFLNDSTFSGLQKLITLDLSSNCVSFCKYTLLGSPFQHLVSLQTLNLESNSIDSLENVSFLGLNNLLTLNLGSVTDEIIHVANATFAWLSNLQSLEITFFGLDNPNPFFGLKSLQKLDIAVQFTSRSDCINFEKCFINLEKLESLSINQHNWARTTCSTIDFCSLSSLQSLDLVGVNIRATNNCFQAVHLKHLSLRPLRNTNLPQPPYEMMEHLTSFHLTVYSDFQMRMQALDSLNSSVQSLTVTSQTDFALNARTFESCAKWNESLLKLDLFCDTYCFEIKTQSSPFKWFSNLLFLRLRGRGTSTLPYLSADTFKGLEHLQVLILHKVQNNIFESEALGVFSKSKFLEIIKFTESYMEGSIGDGLCSISSLTSVDLSYNSINKFAQGLSCTLPNLKVLNLHNQERQYGERLHPWFSFETLCQIMPNLTELHAQQVGFVDVQTCTKDSCRLVNLTTLDLSNDNFVHHDNNSDLIYVPHLENLYLENIGVFFYHSLKVLNIFEAPQLKYLKFGSNFVEVVDQEDALLLSNLTYLGLGNNQLTSIPNIFFRNLRYLDLSGNKLTEISNLLDHQKLEILYLGKNEISIVPKALFSSSNMPLLHTVDLNSNPFACDCSVEPLQKWLLTDTVVNFYHYYAENIYRCVSPDSTRGLSITEVDLDCELPVLMYSLVSITFGILSFVISFLVVWYRWHIQYRLFLLFHRRRNFQNNLAIGDDDDDAGDGNPRYDAYVTYHQQDEDWVGDELEANIEGGEEPFRLCIKNRDIRAGRLIFNAISQSIQRSRKILVILTPRFVEDNWCYFELTMAHHRVKEENANVLIFIILEDIPNNKLTLLLRQLFRKAKCLKWPADRYGRNLFWQRLREELKRPVPLDRHFNV